MKMILVVLLLVGCHSTGLTDGDPDAGAACSTLDQTACGLRADCAVDTCAECSCSPTFVGCRTKSAAPAECPGLGCAQPGCCHVDTDCGGTGATCAALPAPQQCGICEPDASSTCAADSDCSGGQICDPIACPCNGPGTATPLACKTGCSSDADCPEPDACGTDKRCHARPCDATCAGNYECASGACQRKACTKDTDCSDGGACVNGACSRGLGQCIGPAV